LRIAQGRGCLSIAKSTLQFRIAKSKQDFRELQKTEMTSENCKEQKIAAGATPGKISQKSAYLNMVR